MGNLHLVTSYAGKEHITAADQGAFNAALIGTGQFVLDKGNGLAAQVITNNQVRILDGELMMQGRFVRLEPGTYVDLAIESGAQGYYRNDLIVARYTKDSVTGVEGCDLVVIKGTAVTGSPADPAYTANDITNGAAALNDFPLWRIPISGINAGTPESMFGDRFIDSMRTLPEIRASVNRIHSEVDQQLKKQDEDIQKKIDGLESYTKEETLADTTKTLFGLSAAALPNDALLYLNQKKSELEMVLVWENASPTSAFGAQTIAIPASEYDYVLVETSKGAILLANGSSASVGGVNTDRGFSLSENGLSVGDCTTYSSNHVANGSNNKDSVPRRILGIKGAKA